MQEKNIFCVVFYLIQENTMDYIGSTGGALSRTYDALTTYLSRTNHALILRKKYEIFLVFDGIIYIVYNTMDMEENSKKERGA